MISDGTISSMSPRPLGLQIDVGQVKGGVSNKALTKLYVADRI